MLHLHHCIYFADLGIKKDAVFCFVFNSYTSHKKQCHLVPKKYNVKSENTDFFKTLNRHLSPDLTRHQQKTENRPEFPVAVQYWIKQ